MNEDLADALGLPANRGEFVQSVQPGEPAEAAGLQAGDVVLKVDGKDVTPDQTLSFIVANIEPGRRINLEIVRDGQRRTLPVTVGRRPSEEELAAQLFNPDEQDPLRPAAAARAKALVEQSLGLQVIPLTPQIAGQLGVQAGDAGPGGDRGRSQRRRGAQGPDARDDHPQRQRPAARQRRGARSRRSAPPRRKAARPCCSACAARGAPELSVPIRLR